MGAFFGRSSLYRLLSILVLASLLMVILPVAALAAPAQSADTAPLDHGDWYTVQPGDTLSQIAVRYGTTVSALMAANGLANANHIYTGQKLKIPSGGGGNCVAYHTVTYGQTLSGIAVWYGISAHSLAHANDITNYNHIYTGQSLCVPGWSAPPPPPPPSSGGVWHWVTYGDTLSNIAVRYGTTIWAIQSANNLSSVNRILVGTKLWIPSGYAPPPPPVSVPPVPPVNPTLTGGPWTALYYNNKDLSGSPVDTRLDPKINFDWGAGSPSAAVNSDGFSALWTSINSFEAATYQFTSTADDGVRVYVDGTLVIDDWNVHPATEKSGEIALSAGNHTVQVRYFEDVGVASVYVRWAKK